MKEVLDTQNDILKEKFLEIDGRRVSYIEEGKGKPLVLVHGWIGSSAKGFKSIIPGLSKHYHIIAPNFPGYGNSEELKGEHMIDAYADFLKAFLDKKGLQKINLLGSSFGGSICLRFTDKYPKVVQKLILQGAPFESSNFDLSKRFIAFLFKSKLIQKHLGNFTKKKIADFIKSGADFKDLNGEQRELIINNLEETNIKVAAENINSLFSLSLSECSKKVTAPTLIIDGDKGEIITPKASEKLHELISNSKLVLISNAGHTVFLKNPEEFNKEVLEFLKR